MCDVKAVIVAADMVTAYGWGIDTCWKGIISGETSISLLDRFETRFFNTGNAATVTHLKPRLRISMVMQMLTPLMQNAASFIPPDAFLILATTTGEIDILEHYVLNGKGNVNAACFDYLLRKVQSLCGVENDGMVVSAACASSSTAIAQAAGMISSGERDCILVVACDSVSEFVLSGFSSLMALDRDKARPFDKNRNGLSLGEAAGYILLMHPKRAFRQKRHVMGEIAGWGLTNDANHMTGPSRDGSGLTHAMRKAFQSAKITEKEVGCISAHGTGTVYNDSMEMKAFQKIFENKPVPTYSIKGGMGHTLGAAGLVEVLVAFKSLREKIVPPTVNLRTVDNEAEGWVSSQPSRFNSSVTVSTNSGFGGINSAIVLKQME